LGGEWRVRGWVNGDGMESEKNTGREFKGGIDR